MTESKIKCGSGETVSDFSKFCEGDIELSTQKKIKTLIMSECSYIVFLDNDYEIEWSANDDYEWPKNAGKTLNDICILESRARSLLSWRQRISYQRILGECVARMFDYTDDTLPDKFIEEARSELIIRSSERVKIWYILFTAIMGLFFLVTFVALKQYGHHLLGTDLISICMFSTFGSIGSFISITGRLEKIQMNSSSGLFIHYVDSCIRVAIGVLGAFFVILLIKSQLLLGTINGLEGDSSIYIFIVISILCGASERFVPNMIDTLEGSLSNKSGVKDSSKTEIDALPHTDKSMTNEKMVIIEDISLSGNGKSTP